jgi:DNA-directed RNA polymerase subunit RPC12/RpoP
MTGATYEAYTDVECPRCGYTEARDAGPYEYLPGIDDKLGGVPHPTVHLMWCGRCGKSFDVAPAEGWEHKRAQVEAMHERGDHHCCDPDTCAWAAMKIWEE